MRFQYVMLSLVLVFVRGVSFPPLPAGLAALVRNVFRPEAGILFNVCNQIHLR